MRFRPANIRLINRRLILPRLLLALSSGKGKNNCKNNPGFAAVDRVTPYQGKARFQNSDGCKRGLAICTLSLIGKSHLKGGGDVGAYGISRPTAYRGINRYNEKGPTGLVD